MKGSYHDNFLLKQQFVDFSHFGFFLVQRYMGYRDLNLKPLSQGGHNNLCFGWRSILVHNQLRTAKVDLELKQYLFNRLLFEPF